MQYTVDFDVNQFGFWAGAKDVYSRILEDDRVDELQELITEVFCDHTPSDTEINDFVWFDVENIMYPED